MLPKNNYTEHALVLPVCMTIEWHVCGTCTKPSHGIVLFRGRIYRIIQINNGDWSSSTSVKLWNFWNLKAQSVYSANKIKLGT